MTCYHPLHGYRSKSPTINGKFGIVFSPSLGYRDLPMTVPCGQCVGCRLARSRQWAIRCEHEASLHARNCFITLTFAPEHLPPDHCLNVRTFQLFMKKLRKRFGAGIRFYHCGEYGSRFGRPHYHACLFGFDFPDKYLFHVTPRGDRLYRSPALEELWPFGYATIGAVTFESAAYVARYILKKVNGDAAADHYLYHHPVTGELIRRPPEYTTMSRRPGIAAGWIDRYMSDVYPHDVVVCRGARKVSPPRFYDLQYEARFPGDFVEVKARRKRQAAKNVDNNTPERLAVREQVQLARLTTLHRTIDDT